MTVRSGRNVIVGVVIALVVPVSFALYAWLLGARIVPLERDGSTMQTLTTIALTELLLGPIGIAIAGNAAGLRRPAAWLALIVVAVPVLTITWFLCVATLSGALGSPF
jgi:hypothetical protein